MSATDELRRLLDERGVEWENRDGFNDWKTKWERGRTLSLYTENKHSGFTVLEAYTLTPEQAIAATLGGGECEMYRDEYGVWHCSSCEKGADKTTGNDGALESWNDSWPPNFCPYCGKAVKR